MTQRSFIVCTHCGAQIITTQKVVHLLLKKQSRYQVRCRHCGYPTVKGEAVPTNAPRPGR